MSKRALETDREESQNKHRKVELDILPTDCWSVVIDFVPGLTSLRALSEVCTSSYLATKDMRLNRRKMCWNDSTLCDLIEDAEPMNSGLYDDYNIHALKRLGSGVWKYFNWTMISLFLLPPPVADPSENYRDRWRYILVFPIMGKLTTLHINVERIETGRLEIFMEVTQGKDARFYIVHDNKLLNLIFDMRLCALRVIESRRVRGYGMFTKIRESRKFDSVRHILKPLYGRGVSILDCFQFIVEMAKPIIKRNIQHEIIRAFRSNPSSYPADNLQDSCLATGLVIGNDLGLIPSREIPKFRVPFASDDILSDMSFATWDMLTDMDIKQSLLEKWNEKSSVNYS